VLCLFISSIAYPLFAPFSLTNEKRAISEKDKPPQTQTTTSKEFFSEEPSFKEDYEIEKRDFSLDIERLDKERETLLSKEKQEEPIIVEPEVVEHKPAEPEVKSKEEPKEQVKEDIQLLAKMASDRVIEAENRRKMLAMPPEEYERFKTTPGEALKWQLPEESSLNVLGRKFIKMGYSGKSLLNTTEKQKSSNQINIDQELEVKIRGVVKKKVSVNVDYSDKSSDVLAPKKTFEVTYSGEPEEVVQEAKFGDVSLELPQTRFVGYKKSGFGISAKASSLNKKLNISAIASREKGESRSKSFKGTTTIGQVEIQDTSWIRRRFYQVLASIPILEKVQGGRIEWLKNNGYLPIKPGSLRVYIDDKNPNNNTSAIPLTALTYDNSGSYTGYFDLKYPGEDYSFDYNTGILSFKYSLQESDIVAISFIDGLGSITENLLIKNEKTEEVKKPETYQLFELKGYYSLPYRKLNINDPDFSFEIRDSSGKYWYDANNNSLFDSGELTYVRIFGLDREERYDIEGKERPWYNKIDKEFLDLDLGLLIFPDRLPFDFGTSGANEKNRFYYEDKWIEKNIFPLFLPSTLTFFSNPNCYKLENPQTRYTIRIRYTTIEKYGFSLDELNIVPDSEVIYINGNRLSKNEYSIDYETGYITIYRKTNPSDDIKVDYEYAPFFGVYQKSLMGTRLEYKPNNNFSLGTTFIGESGTGLKGAPSVTHPSTSLSILDIDSKISPTEILKEKINYKGPISLTLEGEIAHSIQNPNTYGYGMIDSMDSTENTIDAGISSESWQISSLPLGIQTPRGKIFYYDKEEKKMYPYQERCGPYLEDGGHRSDEEQKKQKMLTFNLSLGTSSAEKFVGLVNSISKGGLDISNYSFLEVWSDCPSSSTIRLYLDIGKVSEDSDGDGYLDTEDLNKDGFLNPGEDIGFGFSTETKCGAKNGQLDSEDLDSDGFLETSEAIFSYLINDEKYIEPTINTASGWRLYRVPLVDFKSKDPEADLRVIKHLRIRFENTSTETTLNTTFHIDKIAILGSNWEKPVITKGTGTISILGKNSKDDSDYVSLLNDPSYKKLHEKEDLKEEGALSISYDFSTNSSSYIRKPLPRTQNYNPYSSLGFWVYGYLGTQSLSIRFGQDDSNCFEYNIGTISPSWRLIKVNLSVFKELLAKKGTQSGCFLIRGSPNLGRINEIRFILEACGKGEIWINELHVSDVIKREANSYFAKASGGWNKWLNFNLNTTKQEGEFRTIGPASTGQETDNIHFDTNITRFSFLPTFSFNYDRKKNDLSYENVDEVSNQRFGYEDIKDKKLDIVFDLNKKINKGFPVLQSQLKRNEFLYRYSDNSKDGISNEITGGITHTRAFKKEKYSLNTSYGFTKQKGSLTDYLDRRNTNEKDAISHSGKTTLCFAPKPYLSGSNLSLEKQITNEDMEYPGREGTETIQKNDKDTGIASLLLKFYPKGNVPLLSKSSVSTEYSITKTLEDMKTRYEGIATNTIIQETKKDNVKERRTASIFPYRTFGLETNYSITWNKETQDSNLSQYIYETQDRAQSSYILHRDNKGSVTIEGNKVSFSQNEARTRDDKRLLLTKREIKYDLDKVEIKRLKFIPLITSTRIDNKFYFTENYSFTTDRRTHKKTASTSSHLGINNTLSEIKWKDYRVGLSTSFTLDANSGYDNISPDEPTLETLLGAYNDFHRGLLFKRKGPEGSLYKKAKRTSASSTRAFGINGDWYLYEPLTTNSKFTLTLKEEENGILWSDIISTEVNNTLDLLRAKPRLSNRWTSASLKANYKIDYSHQYTNIAERQTGITHNSYLELNSNWKNNLKTTGILKTTFSNVKEASGVITKNLEVYPSLSCSYDYTKPGVLKVPFTKKAISLERKLTLNGNFNTSFKRKKRGKIKEISEDEYKLDVSGTYKINENTSGTLGLNLSYFTDRIKAGRDYIGYGSYISLEFRF